MALPRVESEDLSAYFDEERAIAYVIYRGRMTATLTIRAYEWIAELTLAVGTQNIRGSIFDFCAVTDFEGYSLSAVMRESQKINTKMDFSQVPVALIVNSALQERMLRVTLKVTPQDYRKRIVRSEEEALQFIEAWHQRSAQSD